MKLIKLLKTFLSDFLGNERGDYTYDQVQAITKDTIKEEITEGVFTDNTVLQRFLSKQVKTEGGNKILAPLYTISSSGSTGEFYSPRDNLSLDEFDGFSVSEHNYKFLQETVVIYKPDIAKNNGKEGVLSLVGKKVMQAKLCLQERMIKGLLSDGTVGTGNLDADQFVGFAAAVKASGTYGGIAPADLATWVSTVDDNSGTNRTLTKAILDGSYDNSESKATLGICDKNVMTKIKGLVTAQQRTTADRTSNLDGFGHGRIDLIYNGIPYVTENQMDANSLYHIAEPFAKLHVIKGHNMRSQSIRDLETLDAILERIFYYGNLVVSERKYHTKIEDISV